MGCTKRNLKYCQAYGSCTFSTGLAPGLTILATQTARTCKSHETISLVPTPGWEQPRNVPCHHRRVLLQFERWKTEVRTLHVGNSFVLIFVRLICSYFCSFDCSLFQI